MHLVQAVRMFPAVDESADQLSPSALNQQVKTHRGRPELCCLVMLSNILKGGETSLTYELPLTHTFLQAGCTVELFTVAPTTRCETSKIPVLAT